MIGGVLKGQELLENARAAQMDRKMDDGNPWAGSIFSGGDNCGFNDGRKVLYIESENSANCNVFFMLQG